MKIAITGATGFVGSHLTNRLDSEGHELVLIGRRWANEDARLRVTDLSDPNVLETLFTGCKVIAHCAGINREVGNQTYGRVHVHGTSNVVAAAKAAGVEKIVLLSFLRARPDCGSPYHESKWAAEEIVRNSGLDYTVLKAGVIYGRGDKSIRPLAVEDLVHVMRAALIDRRMKRQTVAVLGPEETKARNLSEGVEPGSPVVPLPYDLVPTRRFSQPQKGT